jgi:protein-tyrosine kinase
MKAQEQMLESSGSQRVIARPDRRIGAILAAEGKLTAADINRVLDLQRTRGLRFGEAAVRLGLISVNDLRRALAKQYELPHLLPHNKRLNSELVVAYEPFHACAEQMRALRTQLLMRWATGVTRNSRMLAIVSPGEGEGRSYVAANLAVAFAQLGQRTLLIDADLRRPRQQRIFDVEDRVGLAAVLAGRANAQAVVRIDEFGSLSLLPAGAPPPNPVELLSRDTFPALLQALQTDFDVILFDTPAAKPYADAQAVAFRTRSTLILARKDHTRLVDTTRVIRRLTDAGAETLGTVFNAF